MGSVLSFPSPAGAFEQLAGACEDWAGHYERRPIDGVLWLPGQHAFLTEARSPKLFRAGNQAMGKTWAGLAEVIWRCEGKHPYLKVKKPPIKAWVICASWSQSIEVQEKFWNLVERSQLVEGTNWDPKNGFGDKNPTVKFKNGSVVRFKTTMQGGLRLSAATIDHALFDEPPPSERIYTEVKKRLMRRAGTMSLTLTPINAPVDWLKELCEKDQVKDLHYRLEPQHLVPVGETEPLQLEDGTPMDAAWVEEEIRQTLASEVPVVCHGEWEMRLGDRVFTAFSADPSAANAHVHDRIPEEELELCLGIDYGSRALKQVAILIGVYTAPGEDWPRIYVVDEEIDKAGDRTPDADARAILGMLKRNGLHWHELDRVWGDRLYMKGPKDKKSNKDMQASIARVLRVPQSRVRPKIQTVKRGAGHGSGSVRAGVRYLHHAMLRPDGFGIHPRCALTIEALSKWDWSDDELKDRIDTLRYAIDHHIFSLGRRVTRRRTYY